MHVYSVCFLCVCVHTCVCVVCMCIYVCMHAREIITHHTHPLFLLTTPLAPHRSATTMPDNGWGNVSDDNRASAWDGWGTAPEERSGASRCSTF